MNRLIGKEVELRIQGEDDYIAIPSKITGWMINEYYFEEKGKTMSIELSLEPLDLSIIDDENVFGDEFQGVSLSDIYKL